MNPDVFICYSSKDADFANNLVNKLEEKSVKCWIAPRDIPGGTKWSGEIMRALDHCKTLVFILSNSSNNSDQVLTELETAKDRKIPIIPVIIEDVDISYEIKYFIRSHQWIEAHNSTFDFTCSNIINSLKVHLNLSEEIDSGLDEKRNTQTEAKKEVFHNPYLLVSKKGEAFSLKDIPAIDDISISGRPLIIISNTTHDELAPFFCKPGLYKGVMIIALRAPGIGRKEINEILIDIVTCTGGLLFQVGILTQFVKVSHLGQAGLIKINQDMDGNKSYIKIYNGNGSRKRIKDRIENIKHQIEMSNSDFDNEKYQERIDSFSVEERSYTFQYNNSPIKI